jgi:hypothetical protein
MHELRAGLWHWQAPHPDWAPGDRWPREVSSYAIDNGARLLLFDPQSVPEQLIELAADRESAVVLTAPWHERDTQKLVERLGVPVFVPPPDTADDLMRKYGVTPEQAGGGSPDVAWLLAGNGGEVHVYAAGARLSIGIEPFTGRYHNDLVLWIAHVGAVISGDTLIDFGRGLEINDFLRGGVTRDEVAERLRPLLERRIEVVLPAHGAPTDHAALARALS